MDLDFIVRLTTAFFTISNRDAPMLTQPAMSFILSSEIRPVLISVSRSSSLQISSYLVLFFIRFKVPSTKEGILKYTEVYNKVCIEEDLSGPSSLTISRSISSG
jgi:hypothetical protein